MSEHAPKTQALLAYDVEALSDEGRRRLESHLAGCEMCQRELSAMRLYGHLSEEVREAALPSLDYSRMEFALRREARRQAPGGSRTVAFALLALAAAVLLGLIGLRQRGEQPVATSLPVHHGATAEATAVAEHAPVVEASLEVAVTATVDARVAEANADLDTMLREGDVLETGPAGALHGRVTPGTGFALSSTSKLTLLRIRPSGVVLELDHGRLSSAVRTGTHYQVRAGAYRVVVRGTRFSVQRADEHVHVTLVEGTVAIESAGSVQGEAGETLAVLHAPAEWDSGGAEAAEAVEAVESPIALDADDVWPRVVLPPFPSVEAWELSGARFAAEDELALRAPTGTLTLRAFDARGRAREIELQVLPEGIELTESMLPRVAARASRGTLEPSAIRAVVQARQPALRRCYERVLRRQADPSLTQAGYALRVDVGVRGDVRRVRLTASSGTANEALTDCITHEVRGWTFPAPQGGPVSFSLPLNLSAR